MKRKPGLYAETTQELLESANNGGDVPLAEIDFFRLEGELVEYSEISNLNWVYKANDKVNLFTDDGYMEFVIDRWEIKNNKLVPICEAIDQDIYDEDNLESILEEID